MRILARLMNNSTEPSCPWSRMPPETPYANNWVGALSELSSNMPPEGTLLTTEHTTGYSTTAAAAAAAAAQVRAQQNDRIFRRAVQNLHVQIIEVAGEHERAMTRVKRWRNC